MSRVNKTASNSLPCPLCRVYLLAVLADISISAIEGGCVRDHVLHWGVGVLPDGQQEFLGVWHEPDSNATVWRAISDDLKARGVEDIRVVVGSDPTAIKAAMRASYPGVMAMPAIGHFLPRAGDGLSVPLEHFGPLHAFAPRHRIILRNAIGAANQLNPRLMRAAARHGCFPSPAAAKSFVVDRITRAERDFGTFGVDVFAGPAHPAARLIGVSRIAALGI